jgi:hypothetical protein
LKIIKQHIIYKKIKLSDLRTLVVNKKHLSGKIFILLLTLSFSSFAQTGEPYRKGKVKSRISVSLVKSFYKNDIHMTANTKALKGFNASYKSEIIFLRHTNIILGLDYFNYGLKFHGYYAKPGSTYLFDETFAYTHEIRIQEVQLPLALKIAFNSEKENFYTPYFIGGIGARYIFASYTVISNDSTGITVYDAKDNIDYEHQRVAKSLNAFYHAGLGLQYNYRNSARAIFFELSFQRGISRFHYDGDAGSNNLNIRGNNLLFTLGFRL